MSCGGCDVVFFIVNIPRTRLCLHLHILNISREMRTYVAQGAQAHSVESVLDELEKGGAEGNKASIGCVGAWRAWVRGHGSTKQSC